MDLIISSIIYLLPGIVSFLIFVCLGKWFVKLLRFLSVGHKVRVELPILQKSYSKDLKVPSMGGILLIFTTLVSIYWFVSLSQVVKWFVSVLLLFGGLGFVDDLCKIFGNGLSPSAKIFCQTVLGIFVYHCFLYRFGSIFLVLPLVFVVNSVNIMDGLDGLAFSVVSQIIIVFALVAFSQGDKCCTQSLLALLGSTLGFGLFNYPPAKIFMGDTGSMALGAVVAFSAIYLDRVVFLFLVGIVPLVESIFWIVPKSGYHMPIHSYMELVYGESRTVKILFLITLFIALILVSCIVCEWY